MKKTILAVLMLVTLAPALALAKPGLNKKFVANYPNAKKLAAISCMVCHDNEDSYSLNTYGMDLQKTMKTGLSFVAIEGLDSDGDGFTNIEEIKADVAPGDKAAAPDHHAE